MNLVSYEFVACQDSKKGVLILSEVVTFNLHCSVLFNFYSFSSLNGSDFVILVMSGYSQTK